MGRLATATFVFIPLSLGAAAQETKPAARILAVRAARVLTLEGEGLGAIENGVVLIEDGKIKAVGSGLEIPADAEVIEITGSTAAPGFFDARAALLLDPAALAEDRAIAPTFDVLDAVDTFAREAIEEALRNGVTSVHVAPGPGANLAGRTAVLKLKPGKPLADALVKRRAALRGSVGSTRRAPAGPFARIGEVRSLRDQFRSAKKYREAWEEYREALKEYEEEKAKRAKEEAKGPESREAEEKAGPTESRPATRRRPPREPREADEEFGEDPSPEEAEAAAQEKKEGGEKPEEKKEEKPSLKKPEKPALDPEKEILLEVLDRKLPLRIEAHRAEDILNVLRVGDEYGFDLVLEGATESARIAAEIAKREIPVLLGPPRVGEDAPAEFERNDPATAARLREAGVRIAIGSSGTRPAETRFVALQAALAAAAGLDPTAALRAVPVAPARLSGVGDRLGSLATGKDGDLVLFDGDPLAVGTRVLAVIVDGEVLYRR